MEVLTRSHGVPERYRRLFEASRDGMVILDAETMQILDLNPRLAQLAGGRVEEMLNRDLRKVAPFSENPEMFSLLEKTLVDGVARAELEIRNEDGAVSSLELLCNSYVEYDRMVIQCNVRDISERRNAERRVSESEERFRLLVEGVRDYAIISLDRHGKVAAWNTGAQGMLGFTEEEIVGKPIALIFTPEDRAAGVPDIELGNARTTGRSEDERWHLRQDGSRLFCSGVLTALWDSKRQLRGFAKIMRDMTERRRTEELLRDAQKMESVAVLAAGVAHDFNNLLTSILGNACLALDDLPRLSPIRHTLEDIISTTKGAADLTRQLLAYAGKGRFLVRPCSLSEVVRGMFHLLESSVPRSALLSYDLAEDLPIIEADHSQLQQIVLNLVVNAGEALGNKEGSIRISTGTEERHDSAPQNLPATYVFLEVRDTGPGMDEETKARIFDPFFTTKFMGRGLGLAAVAGIVRQHEGEIQVTGAPGRGSVFRVVFTSAECSDKADGPQRAAISMSRLILVVDDEANLRRLSQEILERAGYRVITAENGQHAVEIFKTRSEEIAAIILDLAMPVMSGEAALPLLRNIRADVPVLIATGFSDFIAAERYGPSTPDGFLQKPFTPQELVEQVRSILTANNR